MIGGWVVARRGRRGVASAPPSARSRTPLLVTSERTAAARETALDGGPALAGGQVESLADLLRELNHQNDVTVAYKAFYNRLARPGFATFMHQMLDRLLERLCVQTLAPEGKAAVSQFRDIVIQDGQIAPDKEAEPRSPWRFVFRCAPPDQAATGRYGSVAW
jgi:hypothetical protein